MIDGYLLAGQLNKSNVRPCQMESFRQSGQTRRNTQCGFSFAEQQGDGERQGVGESEREGEMKQVRQQSSKICQQHV